MTQAATTAPLSTASHRSIESTAILTASIMGVVSLIFGFIFYSNTSLPLFGRSSVGVTTALAVALSMLVIFSIGWRLSHMSEASFGRAKPTLITKLRGLARVGSLSFTYASIGFLLFSSVFFIFQQAFVGVEFDMWSASVVMALSVAVASYVTYSIAVRMTPASLSSALALFLVGGILTSAIAVDNPDWWQYHFSSLGSGGTVSSYVFNITLIIAGMVIVALADYITDDLQKVEDKTASARFRVDAVWLMLAIIGAMLALVGVFVYNTDPVIHNTAAGGMAIVFLALTGFLPLLARNLSRSFYLLNYGFLGILFGSIWLFMGVGYFNLTTFEMVAAAIIFAWLVVFIRQIAAHIEDQPQKKLA